MLPRNPSWFWGKWEDRKGKGRERKKKRERRAGQGSGKAPRLRYDTLIINLWKNIVIKINIPGRRQLSWHADSGQLHFAIDQTGRRAPLWSCVRPCDVAFPLRNTVCAAGPRFRPGRAAFKANGPGRVLGQTYTSARDCTDSEHLPMYFLQRLGVWLPAII